MFYTSESDGDGISDAPTAVVSDTEGHGQIIRQRTHLSASNKPDTGN